MELTIRQAAAADQSYLREICIQLYVDNFAGHWDEAGLQQYLGKVFGEAIMTAELANPDIQYYLAEADGKATGFMKIIHNSPLSGVDTKATIELDKIYISPAFKRAGIGHQLMQVLFDQATNTGKEMIWLKVIDTNEAAIAFYRKKGFEYFGASHIDAPGFRDELRGMWVMVKHL